MNDMDLKNKLKDIYYFCAGVVAANPIASVVLLFTLGVVTGAAFKP